MQRGWTTQINIYLTVVIFCLLVIGCTKSKSSDMGIGTPTPMVCTLLGCGDTLSVTIDGDVPDKYNVLLIDPEEKEIEFCCTQGELYPQPNSYYRPICDSWGFWLRNYAPDIVDIVIEWDGGIVSKTFHPSYEIDYPNGPDCPPGCRVGGVIVTIPKP